MCTNPLVWVDVLARSHPSCSQVLDSNQGETKDIKSNMKGDIGISLYPNLNKLVLFFKLWDNRKDLNTDWMLDFFFFKDVVVVLFKSVFIF